MNKFLGGEYILLLTFVLGSTICSGQTSFGSEQELIKQAVKLFDGEAFEEAYPLYTQLASVYAKDPNYNYRLGVCMLYANDDKEKAIPFLEYAVGKPYVEKEALFYLARAYHLNYRFDDAIKKYQLYKKVASGAKVKKLMVDRQIEMCKNGKKLLRNFTDLVVIDKKEMDKTDFFRAYTISGIGGKLLVKPDEKTFTTTWDKKKKENSIIYLASNTNRVFFSSYGDDPKHGKDIFTTHKLPSGEWSIPQPIGYPINTEYDEDYPFLHPNGKVLYFCSKGHNSMGGYDIFKSTLNEKTGAWNEPVNLDFPINSPDDDILYITNEGEKEAYFSSARASKTGKITAFHINTERKPLDIAIIKGVILKNREGQALDAKITIKNINNNELLGIYNSKADSGMYSITIPNGGKFLFTIETTGFETQSAVVEVPVQDALKPLKQEISYEPETNKLLLKNRFDEELGEASYLSTLDIIKEKSKLDATITAPEQTSVGLTKDSVAVDSITKNKLATAKPKIAANTKLTNSDIIKIAYADAADVEQEAKDIKEQADIALAMANQKNEIAQNKTKEAAQLMLSASAIDNNVKKQAIIEQSNNANIEAEILNQEAVAAFNLTEKLNLRAASKQDEADLSKQYAINLEAAAKSKNPEKALAQLDEQEKKLDSLSEKNNNPTLINSLKIDAENKKRELDKAIQTSADIRQEILDNEKLVTTTQIEADNEHNDKVKQGLLGQIAGLKQDTEDRKLELTTNEIKVNKLQKQYNGIINETKLIAHIYEKEKVETGKNVAASAAAVDTLKTDTLVIKTIPDTIAATNTTKIDSTTTILKTGFKYSSAEASEQILKSERLNTEAEQLITDANKLKTKAAETVNVADKNRIYARSEELMTQAEIKKTESAKTVSALNKAEYVYNQHQLEQFVVSPTNSENNEVVMAEMMKDESKFYFDKSQKLREQAITNAYSVDKELANEDAYKNEMIALEKQLKAIAIYKKQDSSMVVSKINVATSENTSIVEKKLENNKTNKTSKIVEPINNPDTTATVIQPMISTTKIKSTTNELFSAKSNFVYSARKPIPLDEKLPEGLVFKVQIGAFRNPIPQDLFNGMAPIMGETTSQGFIRYTAGLFTSFITADRAKKEIRELGYKDAFIVFFFNGKRISISEAMIMLGEKTPTIAIMDKNTTNTTLLNIDKTQNVSTVGGLFYTIQIGVYSYPISKAQLRNVDPLYIENTPDGNWRYNTGMYNNLTKATEAKNKTVEAGIVDAFVTAYHNGKRISMTEAKLLDNQGISVFATAPAINALPTFNSKIEKPAITSKTDASIEQKENNFASKNNKPVINVEPTTTNELKAILQNNTMKIDTGVVFKIQIGAFKNEVPLPIANQFLTIAKNGIKNYTNENGLTIYLIGNYKTYEEANQMLKEVVSKAGIIDAFIVAYDSGKKISLEKAKTVVNKQ